MEMVEARRERLAGRSAAGVRPPHGPQAVPDAFRRGWTAVIAAVLLAAAASLALAAARRCGAATDTQQRD